MLPLTSKLFYKYLGPTTIHLQHEAILLATLCIFTSASFYTTYHSNKHLLSSSTPAKSGRNDCTNCHWNECVYIILSTLWLSRHLLHRIICTTEANTTASSSRKLNVCQQLHPSCLSTFYKLSIWLSAGGQYFDIPYYPIQLALYGPSSSVSAIASATSSSGRKNLTLRNIIQTNIKASTVGVVDHHRQINKSSTEALLHRKTPPIHRTYIVQVFFVIPLIVLPISTSKFLLSKLSSRKSPVRGYYDSDDSDDDTDRRHRTNDDNDDALWDFYDDNENDSYVKVHLKTQNQVNKRLDTIWKYTPSAQFMVFLFVLSITFYLGFHFYSTAKMLTGAHGGTFNGNGRYINNNNLGNWKYMNPGMNNAYQQYGQNQYSGPGSGPAGGGVPHRPPMAIQSTVLNAELMAHKFEMKQRQKVNIDPATSEYFYKYGVTGIYIYVYILAEKLGIRDWKSTFYGPWGMFYLMSLWGAVASLLLFGRIMLPLPDLTAGGRDLWSGRGSSKSNKQKRKEKIWSESYTSITTGNKFSLYSKILFVRITENLLVCALLPQSSYMCKATGHCNIEPTIFETGDPTVIQREHVIQGCNGMFDNLIQDRLIGNFIALSVIVTSMMMLLGQIVVLDRGSLSLEAYNYIQSYSNNGVKSNDSHTHRRGGKRANIMSGSDTHHFWNENGGSNASVQNNEKNKNLFSDVRDYIYETFSFEMGALSTSRILSFIFSVYAVHAISVVMLTLCYSVIGRDCYPLVLTLIAIFTAAGGSDVDTLDFDEIDDIANEINAAHGM